jgi:hypothetical protein
MKDENDDDDDGDDDDDEDDEEEAETEAGSGSSMEEMNGDSSELTACSDEATVSVIVYGTRKCDMIVVAVERISKLGKNP